MLYCTTQYSAIADSISIFCILLQCSIGDPQKRTHSHVFLGFLGCSLSFAAAPAGRWARYSTFTVQSVDLKTNPTAANPHEIHLEVAPDNKHEDENLPLSPWH